MAEHRKTFRARRLAIGGRHLPLIATFTLALMLGASLQSGLAQDSGLKNGAASLAAGKYDAAVRQLSATINGETASPGEAAKALYLRGIAHRKMGQPARAVADLGAAMWLGLPATDRVNALVNRGLAYRAAGLNKEGEAELAAARKLGGSGAVEKLIAEGGGAPEGAAAIAAFDTEVRPAGEPAASASASARAEPVPSFDTSVSSERTPPSEPPTRTASASPGAWSTSVANEQKPSSGNRLTRWFGSLTDSSDSQPSAAEAPPAPPAEAEAQPSRPATPPPAAASSAWSTTTEAQDAAPSAGGGESKSRWSRLFDRDDEPAAQPGASTGGDFRLQLATSRSEAEAQALWKKVTQTQAVAGVGHEIERVEIGSFGTFYALRLGPFRDKAESLKLCNALKRSGIDCSPVTP
ncbi:MAG TPA: SPOR domain-containing protein [Xanthobacteraceae bacterium]|nr:SPOR domain-containing protein [Xanthobacteraceae bacterium]